MYFNPDNRIHIFNEVIKMEVKVICDLREQFKQNMLDKNTNFTDHPPQENINEIVDSIKKNGFSCSVFGGIPELIEANEKKITFPNSIFLNLTDGLDLECGRVQAPILLDMLGVCYSGAGPFQSALIDNKYYTKLAVRNQKILVPSSVLIHRGDSLTSDIFKKVSCPVIVKPNDKGSSIGITQKNVCFEEEATYQLVKELLEEYENVLIESFIPGFEVTNFIVGNEDKYFINVPIVEKFHGNFLHTTEVMGIEDKAYRTRSFYLASEILGLEKSKQIADTTQKIKESLKVNDILRIDYRVTENGDIYFLEANTVPRISSKNEAGFTCKVLDRPYHYFIGSLIESVLNRHLKESTDK